MKITRGHVITAVALIGGSLAALACWFAPYLRPDVWDLLVVQAFGTVTTGFAAWVALWLFDGAVDRARATGRRMDGWFETDLPKRDITSIAEVVGVMREDAS